MMTKQVETAQDRGWTPDWRIGTILGDAGQCQAHSKEGQRMNCYQCQSGVESV